MCGTSITAELQLKGLSGKAFLKEINVVEKTLGLPVDDLGQ
jgi:hypothetical protein